MPGIEIASHDTAPPAPGELELLQRALNLHIHDEDDRHVDPPLDMIRSFFVERGLLGPGDRFTEADRRTYLELGRAVRNLIAAEEGEPIAEGDAATLDRIALSAKLHPHFHAERPPTLEAGSRGAAAAFGRLVAIAFVSAFDGSFQPLKLCASQECRAIFYDRSKNRSGRWCSMSSCGNRAKVRAWRERQRIED